MKKIALFLSVVIATAMADTAAAKPDTLSIDKTYYPGRRAFYELTPVKKHNIVMLGNSLTERGLWGEYFQPAYVLNRGIGGDCVSGMIARLETILSGKPKAMFIMAGTNDLIFSKTSYEKLLEQYERMLDIIARESPRTKVYIQSLLPLVEDRQDYFKGKSVSPDSTPCCGRWPSVAICPTSTSGAPSRTTAPCPKNSPTTASTLRDRAMPFGSKRCAPT